MVKSRSLLWRSHIRLVGITFIDYGELCLEWFDDNLNCSLQVFDELLSRLLFAELHREISMLVPRCYLGLVPYFNAEILWREITKLR